MSRLNDNEVAYAAGMQQKIDTLMSFVLCLKETIGGRTDAKFIAFCDVECFDDMIDIINFVSEAAKLKNK